MCGRTCCTLYPKFLITASGATAYNPKLDDYKPKWNSTPKSSLPIAYQFVANTDVRSKEELEAQKTKDQQIVRVLTSASWGLIPSFADDPANKSMGYNTINARTDRLESNRLYKRLLQGHRCIVFVDGFYEWKRLGGAGATGLAKDQPKAVNKRKSVYYFKMKPSYQVKPVGCVKGSHLTEPSACTAPGGWREAEIRELQDAKKYEIKVSSMHERFQEATSSKKAKTEKGTIDADAHSLSDTIQPIIFPGFYDVWDPSSKGKKAKPGQERFTSVTILTTDSEGTPMHAIHPRMPCCITPETAEKWIAGESVPFEEAIKLVEADARNTMNNHIVSYRVTDDVGNIANDRPDLIIALDDDFPNDKLKLGKFDTGERRGEDSKKEAPPAESDQPKLTSFMKQQPGAKRQRTG